MTCDILPSPIVLVETNPPKLGVACNPHRKSRSRMMPHGPKCLLVTVRSLGRSGATRQKAKVSSNVEHCGTPFLPHDPPDILIPACATHFYCFLSSLGSALGTKLQNLQSSCVLALRLPLSAHIMTSCTSIRSVPLLLGFKSISGPPPAVQNEHVV